MEFRGFKPRSVEDNESRKCQLIKRIWAHRQLCVTNNSNSISRNCLAVETLQTATVRTTLTASLPLKFQTQFRHFLNRRSTKTPSNSLPKFWTASRTTTLSSTQKRSAKRWSLVKVTSRVRYWLQGQARMFMRRSRTNLRWFSTNTQKSQIQIRQQTNKIKPPHPPQCSSLIRRWSVLAVKATWWVERRENLTWLICSSWPPTTTKCRKWSLVWVWMGLPKIIPLCIFLEKKRMTSRDKT